MVLVILNTTIKQSEHTFDKNREKKNDFFNYFVLLIMYDFCYMYSVKTYGIVSIVFIMKRQRLMISKRFIFMNDLI